MTDEAQDHAPPGDLTCSDETVNGTVPFSLTRELGQSRSNSPPPHPPSSDLLVLFLRPLASLRLAVVLLALYAGVLAAATLIEKYNGADAARDKVYGTPWFAAIHLLLAVNVLCALAIRFPWRRRMGFAVTHAGVLVLLAGSLATWRAGVEAQLVVWEGHASHDAYDNQGPLALGFQIYLRQFRQKLDPGSTGAGRLSSEVDFLDCGSPPRKLRENVTIAMNQPTDFTDPESGRTYRISQSGPMAPLPLKPGSPEFDEMVGGDRSRNQVYRSQLQLNCDPGRGLKYAGSLLVIVGMLLTYCRRRPPSPTKGQSGDSPGVTRCLILSLLILPFLASGVSAAVGDEENLDWSVWRRLPVFSDGRVMPLDTFARNTVESICGRADPTLRMPDGRCRRFSAAEVLFGWLMDAKTWENAAFLPVGASLREQLALPLEDADGRRLHGASPAEIGTNMELRRRWIDLRRRSEQEDFQTTDADRELDRLVNAYEAYQALTFDPHALWKPAARFRARGSRVADAFVALTSDLQAAGRISRDPEVRRRMVEVAVSWQRLTAALHEGEFSLARIEPAMAAFCRASRPLASQLSSPDDVLLSALAADLRHQADQMHVALYDSGRVLRLAPELDAGALDARRTPDDDASPWLGYQAIVFGSDALLEAYPRAELPAVRRALADVKAAYLDRRADDRPVKFAAAMDRLAQSLRALAEAIEPLREKLPILHRDQVLLDATAYPPRGSTDAEVFYNWFDPFFWSWVVSLGATLCLLAAVGRWRKPLFWLGAAMLTLGQGCTAAGLGLRAYITGLVPLTGMFETVVFVAFFAGMLGLAFALLPLCRREPGAMARILQRRPFVLAGAIVGVTAAVLAYYAPASVMHRNLGAVTPILRDNFWLAVHVVTIMASYASAAIALILGNIALGYYLFGRYGKTSGQWLVASGQGEYGFDAEDPSSGGPALRLTHPTRRRPPAACALLSGFIYTAIGITVVLLAAGTILGALWADKAWGRFWGWDPKEVWALISLLVYLVFLHARHIGWSRDFGMAVTAVFGFTAILFTWYAVNFILGSGKHAYGSGAGGAWAVGGAVAVELLFLAAAAGRHAAEARE
jgi:cytochrome c-type biogenesis protein CcsB